MNRLLFILLALALPASGANLIPNSGWECGIGRGWMQWGTANDEIIGNSRATRGFLTNDAHSGRYSFITKGFTYSRAMYLASGAYTFSFWCKCTTDGAGPFFFGVLPGGEIGTGSVAGTTNIANVWTRYTLGYTASSNSFYHVTFFTFQTTPDFLIDDLQLESGSSATTWAPEASIEMALSSENTNRMWFAGDSPTFTMNFWNNGAAAVSRAHYDIFDSVNSNLFSTNLIVTLTAATNTSLTLAMPSRFDWYRVSSRLLDVNDSGDEMDMVCYPYVSNIITHATNDWLGGHGHAGLFHVQRDIRANRKWHRTLSPNYKNTRWDYLEPTRGATYVFVDQYVTNLTYAGMNVLATLTPFDGVWPTWATNADGTADLMAFSNFNYQVVAHLKNLGVKWYEMGPNEPFQSGPTGFGPFHDDSLGNPDLYAGATNKPINVRVSTNYAKALAAGISGATNGDPAGRFIAMAGASGDGGWADEVWTNLPPGITNWIHDWSTHQYPTDNSTDPNDGEYAGLRANTISGWASVAKTRGVQLWNTESGTYATPSQFKGMNGLVPVSFSVIENKGAYPEAWRGDVQQRQVNSTFRILTMALRTIGYGGSKFFYYDNRYFNVSAFNGSTPYGAGYSQVDHPHVFALSVAASMIRAPGFGPITNTTTSHVESYICTNSGGFPVVMIWAADATNHQFVLDNSQFGVIDFRGNQVQTNNATVRVGRLPQYLVSGIRTVAQLSNSVRTATVTTVADNLAPRVSIDIAPSGIGPFGATELIHWVAIDETSTANATNTETHTSISQTNVATKWKLDSGPYSAYSQSNYVWLPSLTSGNHTFYVTGTDAAGNTQEVLYEFVPPTVVINISGTVNIGTITIGP